ncbi:MAG: hypothetical protein NC095_12265 [Muribaculum sp.]|nr:hypothetical protein [Muribaculum sp.]
MRSLLTLFLAVVSVCSFAQDNIQFGVGKVSSTSGLSDEASNVLQSKLSQILNRNSAAAGGEFGVFEVVATIDVESSKSTSGLIKNVMQISGNVVLTAKNAWDNAEYYSVSVPVSAVSNESVTDPALLLARSIKVTEPAYVRFIKKARENISRALEQDCDVTVERAQAFITSGHYGYALNLLLALPPGNSCNDLSQELIASIRAHKDSQIQKREDKEREIRADNMKIAEMILTGNAPSSSADDESSSQTNTDDADIFSSDPNWTLSVVSCKWIQANRRVSVALKVETKKSTGNSYFFKVENAISESGDTFSSKDFTKSSSYLTVPANVAVKCSFDIKCDNDPKELSYIRLSIGDASFEIKNLQVSHD